MTQAQVNTGYGTYGPQTTRAVASLQKSLGVDTSGGGVGYFGPRTLKAVQTYHTKTNNTANTINNQTTAPTRQTTAQVQNTNTYKTPTNIKTPQTTSQTSSVTYSSGSRGTPTKFSYQTNNGIKSSIGGVDKWNAFNNKQLRDVYMYVSPQEAIALKDFGFSPKAWNTASVLKGKSSPFAQNPLKKAMARYNAKQAQTKSTINPVLKQVNESVVNGTAPTKQRTQTNGNTYTIKSGDTLSKIANQNNTTINDLIQSNPQITNPNLIYSGSKITIPTTVGTTAPTKQRTQTNGNTYTIKSGDTLSKIANQNNTTINDLIQSNPQITNPNLIYSGSKITIPTTVGTTAPTKQRTGVTTGVTTGSDTQGTNIVDGVLKKFNTAIVNNDTSTLNKLGAIPADIYNKQNNPIEAQTTTPYTPIKIDTTPTATATTAPTLTLTPEQAKAQALSGELQGLNTSMEGRSTYQDQQNKLAGVDQVQQAIQDNNLAISRLNKASEQLQLTSENRLAPMSQITGEQAQIARQRSFQMLGLSAISDALSNNLVSAQKKADEAVQLKYGPIEEKIKVDTANLALIRNSPQATLDQKKQANAMIIENRQKANDLVINRTNQSNVFKVMTLAAQNKDNFTPTSEYPTLSTAMQAITDAKTPQDALVIATNTGMIGTKKEQGGFSLSQGQTRYDAQGNVIASSAPRASTTSTTKSISSTQLKMFINKQIATKAFQELSDNEKVMYIRSQGGDPYNFGF